ncbi:hypothetical protein R1flu_002140 [Riccia fluitans]|uniref:Dynein axonemal assembly factor 11-like CS domain-containing protein n=1 Tax=Riccia fluitans TaxID=41844 RepID=A0ABD1Y5T4_9MARC
MGPITVEMIRKRSEHNDGVLETLEELVLQEEGIDKIETLGRLCPNLKILYMPNNLIPRLENMNRLKALEYLNLAINNITKFDGLEGCEMLNKLDLTLNFIDKEGLMTATKLRANIHLKELFLPGNPCTDYPEYRKYVIAAVPSLKSLDSQKIKPSERIAAQQAINALHAELSEACNAPPDSEVEQTLPQLNEKGEEIRDYTVANRVQEYNEMQRLKEEEEKKSQNKSQERKSKRRTGFEPLPTEGRIYQRNEGGFDFTLLESDCGRLVLCDVAVGRYLDTSLIDVDVQPSWLRILVKGKLLQLKLPCEVKTDESFVQRSTTTGRLLVTMPKVVPDRKWSNLLPATSPVPHLKSKVNASAKISCSENVLGPSAVVDIHNIVPDASAGRQVDPLLKHETQTANIIANDVELMKSTKGEDNDTSIDWENDVPPLE